MTNFSDEYLARIKPDGSGIGKEVTEGVPKQGFVDASGEFPKREYFYDTSINKAATGEKQNNLSMGGGDVGVDLDLPDQEPSIFPFNQIQETPSGHSFEMDDTPGGERVLIKHRTGAGIELRADGSVLISTRRQRVEVVGGDSKVIVEGQGDLVYKGNVNLRVDGDFNIDVGGDYNINVAGDKKEEIKGRHTKTVNRDQNHTIRGTRGTQVVGQSVDTVLGDRYQVTKGDMKMYTQASTEILTGTDLITTAVNEWVCAASTANVTARTVSMIGHKGTFGGPMHDYYGKTYGGLPGGITNLSTFYGTLVGRATEAIHADYAIQSSFAQFATSAKGAMQSITAVKEGGPKPTITIPTPKMGIMPYLPVPATAPLPNPAIVELQLSTSKYGIRGVSIDSELENKIKKSDDYKELFSHDPSIHEIRSKLRDTANLNNGEFTSYLVGEGKLNSDFKKNLPTNIGRTASRKGTLRFGMELIGNNPADTRSKRFKVNTK
jgi:hypothetical protein